MSNKYSFKSEECSRVLQMMDMDFSYETALRRACIEFPSADKKELEKELDQYI